MKIKPIILAFLANCVVVSTANAAVVTWTLQDVILDDGGTAEGSYDYDADTNTVSNVNVTTSAGTNFAGSVYFENDPQFSFTNNNFLSLFSADPTSIDLTGTPTFSFLLDDVMTSFGGLIAINSGGEDLCADTNCVNLTSNLRLVLSGSVLGVPASEVPLPAALPLFLSGIAGFRIVGRKRRRRYTKV